jgi:hypothetical protein
MQYSLCNWDTVVKWTKPNGERLKRRMQAVYMYVCMYVHAYLEFAVQLLILAGSKYQCYINGGGLIWTFSKNVWFVFSGN